MVAAMRTKSYAGQAVQGSFSTPETLRPEPVHPFLWGTEHAGDQGTAHQRFLAELGEGTKNHF